MQNWDGTILEVSIGRICLILRYLLISYIQLFASITTSIITFYRYGYGKNSSIPKSNVRQGILKE